MNWLSCLGIVISIAAAMGAPATAQLVTEMKPPKAGSRLVVTVRTDKADCSLGDTITGSLVLRNEGHEAASIPAARFPQMIVLDGAGVAVPRRPAKIFICGTAAANAAPIVIAAGASANERFSIETDPLELAGSYAVGTGRYSIALADMSASLGIPTTVRGTEVEIRQGTTPVGNRILQVAAGDSAVIVLRESGLVEFMDLDFDRVIASARLEQYSAPPSYAPASTTSMDAKRLAWRPGSEHWNGGPLQVVSFDGHSAAVRSYPLDGSVSGREHSIHIVGFDGAGERVLLKSWDGASWLDLASGLTTSMPLNNGEWSSPDTRFFVEISGGVLRVRNRERHVTAEMEILGTDLGREVLCGREGVYVGGDNRSQVTYVSYDASVRRSLATAASTPLVESRDGKLVCLQCGDGWNIAFGGKPDRLEVWDLASETKLWELKDDQYRVPVFSGDSGQLICARRVNTKSGVSWLDSVLEIRDARTGELNQTCHLKDERSGAGPEP
jgi:hypothetical protein